MVGNMAKKLSATLSQFVASSNSSNFNNPDNETEILDYDSFIEETKERKREKKEQKKPKSKKDEFERVIEKGEELMKQFTEDQLVDEFDGYIDNYFLDEEDDELKRNLIRYGRKYARDTQVSQEASEIEKEFSGSEKRLEELLSELTDDSDSLQKDISNMRALRTRNYKTLSEMVETKATYHNTRLAVIKEMNAMKKNRIELKMKADKTKKEEQGDETSINRTIQGLFGLGRENLLDSYSDVSGSAEAGMSDNDSYDYDEDEYIQKKYFSNDSSDTVEDGDIFLKYEGMGAHFILLYNESGDKQIIVEDNKGNILPDYPIPTNIDDLEFTISESTGTATDNFANQYELRKM